MRLSTAILLIAAFASPLGSQGTPPGSIGEVPPWSRVHIRYMQGGLTRSSAARFLAVINDSVTVQVNRTQHSIPLGDVLVLRVARGRSRGVRTLAYGVAAGAAVGLVATEVERNFACLGFCGYGYPEGLGPDECSQGGCESAYPAKRRLALVGIGTGAGVLVAALLPPTRWRRLELRPSASAMGPSPSIGIEVRRAAARR